MEPKKWEVYHKRNSLENVLRRSHGDSSLADAESNQFKVELVRKDSKKYFFSKGI